MAVKTGVPTLQKVARSLCYFIYLFGPVIRRVYADNATLLAALDTARAACLALEVELEQVRVYGD